MRGLVSQTAHTLNKLPQKLLDNDLLTVLVHDLLRLLPLLVDFALQLVFPYLCLLVEHVLHGPVSLQVLRHLGYLRLKCQMLSALSGKSLVIAVVIRTPSSSIALHRLSVVFVGRSETVLLRCHDGGLAGVLLH